MRTCCVVLLLVLCANGQGGRRRRQLRPNIILILTDDQDAELGGASYMPKTKALLQDQGVSFRHMFSTTPLCCPSRSSILTGLYVHNHHVYTNNDNCSSVQWQKGPEKRTFATRLNQAGYRTAFFGKYLNRYKGDYIPPGWREWQALLMNSKFYNYTVNVNGFFVKHGDDYRKDYYTDEIFDASLHFMRESKRTYPKKPFMAFLSLPAPHGPEDAAPQYQNMFLNVTSHHTPAYDFAPNSDKQWILRVTGQMDPLERKFTDMLMTKRLQTLMSVDDGVDKVVQELKDMGELNNTFIFFTSDHGYHLGQYGVVKGKAFPFETDIRVPFFVRGPGVAKAKVLNHPVALIDLAPTFLDIAGVAEDEAMDGQSILPLLMSTSGSTGQKESSRQPPLSPAPWRDAVLIERGRPDKEGRHSLLAMREELCSKPEYQAPCTEAQAWVCIPSSSGRRLRLVKCRGKKRSKCACDVTSRLSGKRRQRHLAEIRRRSSEASRKFFQPDHKVKGVSRRVRKRRRKRHRRFRRQAVAEDAQLEETRRDLTFRIKQLQRKLQKLREERRSLLTGCACAKREERRRSEVKEAELLAKAIRKQRRLKKGNRKPVRKKRRHCSNPENTGRMSCFSHDSSHWRTPPLWTEGPFCACSNAINNTYACVRRFTEQENTLYCVFSTGLKMFFDLNLDPYQLRNVNHTLTQEEEGMYELQLEALRDCRGTRACSLLNGLPIFEEADGPAVANDIALPANQSSAASSFVKIPTAETVIGGDPTLAPPTTSIPPLNGSVEERIMLPELEEELAVVVTAKQPSVIQSEDQVEVVTTKQPLVIQSEDQVEAANATEQNAALNFGMSNSVEESAFDNSTESRSSGNTSRQVEDETESSRSSEDQTTAKSVIDGEVSNGTRVNAATVAVPVVEDDEVEDGLEAEEDSAENWHPARHGTKYNKWKHHHRLNERYRRRRERKRARRRQKQKEREFLRKLSQIEPGETLDEDGLRSKASSSEK